MTEEYTVRFTSPGKDCDLCSTVHAVLDTDPNFSDCNVDVRPASDKSSISVTGPWHAISHLRSQLVAVLCTATEEKQILTGGCVQSLVDKALGMDTTEKNEEARSTKECTTNTKSEGER